MRNLSHSKCFKMIWKSLQTSFLLHVISIIIGVVTVAASFVLAPQVLLDSNPSIWRLLIFTKTSPWRLTGTRQRLTTILTGLEKMSLKGFRAHHILQFLLTHFLHFISNLLLLALHPTAEFTIPKLCISVTFHENLE